MNYQNHNPSASWSGFEGIVLMIHGLALLLIGGFYPQFVLSKIQNTLFTASTDTIVLGSAFLGISIFAVGVFFSVVYLQSNFPNRN